jgi:hydroxyacylglutathione hydrolase
MMDRRLLVGVSLVIAVAFVTDLFGLRQARQSGGPDAFDVQWIHGSEDCGEDQAPPVQAYRFNDSTWILRQNKCVHYEAPFIYLLLGDERALMQDTGAVAGSDVIRKAVDGIIERWQEARGGGLVELVVSHSHGHGDHVAGDGQFEDRANTVVVGNNVDAVQTVFGISDWPRGNAEFDLGGRVLDILAIPGHHESHVAIYDRQTEILMTGDTLYPGRLYVWDWSAYRDSISRLVEFTRSRRVSHVLGTHIEMSNQPGIDYPVRTRYQPDEHPLELRLSHLVELHEALVSIGAEPLREVHDSFIIVPRQ